MLKKIIMKLKYLYKIYIVKDRFTIAIKQWYRDNGEEKLRLDYELNENSLVFDLGGHVGDFALSIYNKYKCNIYIFEPVDEFYKEIEKKFENNSKVKIFNFGLTNINEDVEISLNDTSSSVFIENKSNLKKQTIKLVSISEFLNEYKINKINLLKINIEGGEFDVLPELYNNSIINKIDNLQIQFHEFINDSTRKREEIQNNLSKTHELTYNYYFVWENWKLKKSDSNI